MTLSVLVLLLLSSFAIRSSLPSHRRNKKQSDTGHVNASGSDKQSSPPSSPSASGNTQMIGMRHTGRVSTKVTDATKRQQVPQSTQNPQNFTELAKWKAVEIFKVCVLLLVSQSFTAMALVQIMVNYLQVIAVAISVNVSWTEALVGVFETAGRPQVAE